MRSFRCFRFLVVIGALALALPLFAAGCKSSSDDTTVSSPGNGSDNGSANTSGNGTPTAANNTDTGSGNSSGNGSDNSTGGAPAPAPTAAPVAAPAGGSDSATSPDDVKVPFSQVKKYGLRTTPLVLPDGRPAVDARGKKVPGYLFRYQPRRDMEGLLPLLNDQPTANASGIGAWTVHMPRIAAAGNKTWGEWENLFCTYVVPDRQAIAAAQQAVIAKLDQDRAKVYHYGNHAYKIDIEAGDTLPSTALNQVNDVVVTSMPGRLPRAALYSALADQARRNGHPDQARVYEAAALAAVGDLAYENGRPNDALWLYKQAPKVAR